MPTLSLPRRILAGIVCVVSLIACPASEDCDSEYCTKLDWEVSFTDIHERGIDTLGTAGLKIFFDVVHPTAKSSASTGTDCPSCVAFIVTDSAILLSDKPIVSPEGDTVPAGSNLLKAPWKEMVGSGDLFLAFRQGVRLEPGPYAFSMKAPWVYKGIRVVLSDTSYLQMP